METNYEAEIDFKTDWQNRQVELLKTLYGYEMEKVNEDTGNVDYVLDEDEGKKLLRVIVDSNFNASKIDIGTTENTLEELENGGYDEAIILGKDITTASKRMVKKYPKLKYMSSGDDSYSITEFLDAIQRKTNILCKAECGQYPTKKDECSGFEDGKYVCEVRRINDDAYFHVERSWLSLLKNDFFKLVKISKEKN